VSNLVDTENVANLDTIALLLRTRQGDGEVARAALLDDRYGNLVAVGVGDGVVDADEVAGLGGLDGLDDVVDHGRVFVVESLAGAERAAELVVVLGGHGDHVDARCDGELDSEGANGGAGTVNNEGLAGLGGSQGGILKTHEALLAGAVETCGGGVDGQGEDDGFVVAGALGDLGSDGSRSGGVELEGSVLGVLGSQAGGVAKDTVALGQVLHIRANFDNFAGNVAADDHWPGLDEQAGVLDLPVDGVDSDGVVLNDNLGGAGLGHVSTVDAELLVLAI